MAPAKMLPPRHSWSRIARIMAASVPTPRTSRELVWRVVNFKLDSPLG